MIIVHERISNHSTFPRLGIIQYINNNNTNARSVINDNHNLVVTHHTSVFHATAPYNIISDRSLKCNFPKTLPPEAQTSPLSRPPETRLRSLRSVTAHLHRLPTVRVYTRTRPYPRPFTRLSRTHAHDTATRAVDVSKLGVINDEFNAVQGL